MIFYNIHTFTIDRYIRFEATKDIHLIAKIWLPEFLLMGRLRKLMNEISILYNQKEINEVEESEVLRLLFVNKLNMLNAMYLVLFLTTNEAVKADFKEHYGKEFQSINDLNLIRTEMKFLLSKINTIDERTRRKSEQPEKSTPFSDVVVSVEGAIGRQIDRKISVYQFKSYFDQALKTSRETRRQSEKLKEKKHG